LFSFQEDAMNNPKTRDDDQRSSIANQKLQTIEEKARGTVEGGEADKQRQQKEGAKKSQIEGPAAYAPHDEGERAFPNRDPSKKKTGEF
jgi:hypothetical protein